jgi:hypothetical protein
MWQLLFLAVGANGQRASRQKIMRAAKCSAALGMTPFRIRHGACSFLVLATASSPQRAWASFKYLGILPLKRKRPILGRFLDFLVFHPAAQVSQCFPSRIAWTLITGACCLVAVLAAARAKSFTIWLAQRPGRQGQEHLFPEHVFKRNTTVLIIPDFRLRRGDCMLRPGGIDAGRPKKQIELAGKAMLHRFHAACAWDFKGPAEAALEPDVGHDLLGTTMLVQHLGAAFSGQIAQLLGLTSKINGGRRQGHGKLDWLAFKIGYGEEHDMSLRRAVAAVNA